MIFFTADQHFFHHNVIKHDNRPYVTIQEMNYDLIGQWNSVVSEKDEVYHLGDLFWSCKPEWAENILDQLNGKISLIAGNHDKKWLKGNKFKLVKSRLVFIEHYYELRAKNYTPHPIVLCHYPLRSWNRKPYGSWHLHGHCHGNMQPLQNSLDVGCTTNDYKPYSIVEIAENI